MTKLIAIAGIRPQFIKMASFQMAISKWNENSVNKIDGIFINTGQHYDVNLAGCFIKELNVKFDIDFTASYSDLNPITIFSEMIVKLFFSLRDIGNPDWVVVFGDANTTLAGAIAAKRNSLKLIHIEAGLRAGNLESLEEQNRVLTDHLADINILSSKQDAFNLEKEGLLATSHWAGDLIYDLILEKYNFIGKSLTGKTPGSYILVTLHHEENLNKETIEGLLSALVKVPYEVIFVTHPRTKKIVVLLGLDKYTNIKYIDSLSYFEMLAAINGCKFIITDSGALQRESYYLKKRCLILQNNPFWPSLVKQGIHLIVSKGKNQIISGIVEMEGLLAKEIPDFNDLGDGHAGERILRIITSQTEEL